MSCINLLSKKFPKQNVIRQKVPSQNVPWKKDFGHNDPVCTKRSLYQNVSTHRTFPDNILLEQLLPPANYLIRTWMDGQDEFVIEWKVGNRSVLDCPCRTWCTPRKSSSQRGTGKECVSLNRREGTRLHVVINRADACPIESHNKNDNAL